MHHACKLVQLGLLQVLRKDIVTRLLVYVPHQPSQEELNSDPLLYRFSLFLILTFQHKILKNGTLKLPPDQDI